MPFMTVQLITDQDPALQKCYNENWLNLQQMHHAKLCTVTIGSALPTKLNQRNCSSETVLALKHASK